MYSLVWLLTKQEDVYFILEEDVYFHEVSLLSVGISVHPMSWISLLHYHIIMFYLLDVMLHDHSLYFLLPHNLSKTGLCVTFFPISYFHFFKGFVFKWSGAPFLWSIVFSQFLGSAILSCLLPFISHTYSLHTHSITTFIWRASLAPDNGPKRIDFIWWQQHSHFRRYFSTKHMHGVKYMYQFNNTPPDSRIKVYDFSTIHCNAYLQQIHTDCYNTLSSQYYATYRL